jgi:hypothetical protein
LATGTYHRGKVATPIRFSGEAEKLSDLSDLSEIDQLTHLTIPRLWPFGVGRGVRCPLR